MPRPVAFEGGKSPFDRERSFLQVARFAPRTPESARLPLRSVVQELSVRIRATLVRAPPNAVRVPVRKFLTPMRFVRAVPPDVRRRPFPVPSWPWRSAIPAQPAVARPSPVRVSTARARSRSHGSTPCAQVTSPSALFHCRRREFPNARCIRRVKWRPRARDSLRLRSVPPPNFQTTRRYGANPSPKPRVERGFAPYQLPSRP